MDFTRFFFMMTIAFFGSMMLMFGITSMIFGAKEINKDNTSKGGIISAIGLFFLILLELGLVNMIITKLSILIEVLK